MGEVMPLQQMSATTPASSPSVFAVKLNDAAQLLGSDHMECRVVFLAQPIGQLALGASLLQPNKWFLMVPSVMKKGPPWL